jgi:acetyltransferase-like isoleucine patch superfamily enzyme
MRRVSIPRQWSDVRIYSGVALDDGVTLLSSEEPAAAKIDIGKGVYLNRNTFVDASLSITIGEDTMIGPNCYITDHDHAYAPGARPADGTLTNQATRIGARVWLGAGVIVLKGVTIEDDCIIGAGSVVTRSIPANSVAVGVPAKVASSRVTD